jgi:hypothetical protein
MVFVLREAYMVIWNSVVSTGHRRSTVNGMFNLTQEPVRLLSGAQ